MQDQRQDAAVENGFRALQKQQFQQAYDAFKSAEGGGLKDERIHMGLAIAARGLGDHDACLEAIDKFLADNQTHLRALILRGDALKAGGEDRRAIASYMVALQNVPQNTQLDQNTLSELRRIQNECAKLAGVYEDWLRDYVSEDLGSAFLKSNERHALTMDLIFGKAQIYHQQPKRFYFPELPQRQFYDRGEFAWTEAVEAASDHIKQEFADLASSESRFGAYIAEDGREPYLSRHMLADNSDWSAIHLIRNGERIEDNLACCPKTMAALSHAPLPDVRANSPTTLFSRLAPGTHIPPHHGMMNTRLICHLPLVLPDNCSIRVGNQTRHWTDGEVLIFDDTIEHEARNDSRLSRSVLIFDVWRPELTESDRALVISIFSGIKAFGE